MLFRYRKFDADNGGTDDADADAVVMFFIALAVLVLTLVGYFLFFQNPSQSECSNNVAEQGSDPGSGETVTGSEATTPAPIATSVLGPGVSGEEEVVASVKNVQICRDADEMEKNPSDGALKPTASDTPSLTTEQLPGPAVAVPKEAPAIQLPEDEVVAAVETQAEVAANSSEIHSVEQSLKTTQESDSTAALPDANEDLNDFHLGDVRFTVGESSTDDFAATEVLENKLMNEINVDMSAPKNVRISENSGNSHGHQRINNRVSSHSSPSKFSSGKISSDHSSLTKILENETDGDIVAANSVSESDKPKLRRQETMYESAEVVTFASR